MLVKLGQNQNSSCTNEKFGDLETDLELTWRLDLEIDLEAWQSDYKRGHTAQNLE